MGLFSKRKKASAAEAAAAQAAEQKRLAAEAHLRQAAAAKSAADQKRAREVSTFSNITTKEKDIESLQNAVLAFENDRKKEALLAIQAKKAKKTSQATMHLGRAKRLETKIKQYQVRIAQNMSQLEALENASSNLQHVADMANFTENIKDLSINPDDVQDNLQNMREAMNNVTDVNLTFQADVNLNPGMANQEDDLAALEAEFGEEIGLDDSVADVSKIPAAPSDIPKMPARAAASAAVDDNEEEFARLEREIAL